MQETGWKRLEIYQNASEVLVFGLTLELFLMILLIKFDIIKKAMLPQYYILALDRLC